jgi:cell fate (sporulation/competence/biofilm development) regulator YmcA (YheA/YmcA/DUF963 family)
MNKYQKEIDKISQKIARLEKRRAKYIQDAISTLTEETDGSTALLRNMQALKAASAIDGRLAIMKAIIEDLYKMDTTLTSAKRIAKQILDSGITINSLPLIDAYRESMRDIDILAEELAM